MAKLKERIFTSGWKNETKKTICYSIALFLVCIIWLDYIFKPINQALSDYSNGFSTQGDPVIVLGLAGFLLLSAWFLFTHGIVWISWSIFKTLNLFTRVLYRIF